MLNQPYFCPNCRSNRVKFNVITSYLQKFLKDAVSGEIREFHDPEQIPEEEPMIQCQVCQFTGNEQRFVKQAERQPRTVTITNPTYI
ncbi:hypothetical protein ABNB59_07195 [Paenibacillus larvae]|uniref:Uncharacterized protein n=4 Tax=Paenibacillus larvae TaxID=1464 RepID=V9W752_9BACL|nr:hypothetical protein [Paenibacillus larvae]AHD05978.1 hypothetical protein ERIC2_c21850 [Paenibacillus larvae subsp. larvae DSM 25430]AQR76584.1 hypothetical protein BXP28_03475 [Paenibacillus larvae subsp. larvae]AQT83654.1 hypothetical protein B1222_03325 [Paenibacillus larvae subsp. pulvifaciens]AQZ48798.1 hypothetical protein B5S25_21675 [Paenibacillus larvae subsp. pulvifaciens]ARF69902.1 hypothetical protein B7C51_21745 [Paenibacillus larvae subsp. pulvifaciens]